MTTSLKEERNKGVGANYVLAFYEEVKALTQQYALYINALLEAEQAGVEEQRALLIKDASNNMRFLVISAYAKYSSIVSASKQLKKDKEIENGYKEVKGTLILKREMVEDLVLKFNDFIATETMEALFMNSSKVVEEMFKQ